MAVSLPLAHRRRRELRPAPAPSTARKRGISFAGHVPLSVTAAEASDAGQRSIEHLSLVIAGCSREEKETLPELRRLTALLLSPATPMAEKMSAGPQQLGMEGRLRASYDEAAAQKDAMLTEAEATASGRQ
jgi:hypothetical protein